LMSCKILGLTNSSLQHRMLIAKQQDVTPGHSLALMPYYV
jgi:hypothetical protein